MGNLQNAGAALAAESHGHFETTTPARCNDAKRLIPEFHDPTCVRRGTRVWIATRDIVDCKSGNELGPPLAEPVEFLPPFTGGSRGGVSYHLTAIDHLQPGDQVTSHDGLPYPIRRVIERPYRGWMVCLHTDTAEMPLWLTIDHRILARLRPRTLGGNRDWSGSPEWHDERRRELRRDATLAERKLWSVLRGSSTGFKFRRQHSLGPYIADFYSRNAHLVVEIDGDSHFTPEGRDHDRRRDAFLRSMGLDVLRITAHEVDTNLEGVWQGIQNQCRLRTETVADAKWVQAGSLVPGDIVFAVTPSPFTGKAGAVAATVHVTLAEQKTPPLNPPVNGGRHDVRSATELATKTPSPLAGRAGAGVVVAVGALPLLATTVISVDTHWSEESVFDLEIERAHSFVTEVCAVHNCGSGTPR